MELRAEAADGLVRVGWKSEKERGKEKEIEGARRGATRKATGTRRDEPVSQLPVSQSSRLELVVGRGRVALTVLESVDGGSSGAEARQGAAGGSEGQNLGADREEWKRTREKEGGGGEGV